MFERLINGVWTPVTGDSFVQGGAVNPVANLSVWSPQELTSLGFRIAPPPPVNLLAYAANKRWTKEVGGIVVAGASIATDDRSKTLLLGARLRAEANPDVIEEFEAADGVSVTLNAAAILAISDAVGEHTSQCFKVFKIVKTGIAGGTITTTAQIDAAFAEI